MTTEPGSTQQGTPDTGKPFYDGKITDPALIGHLENRGWKGKDAATVAIEAITAHWNAEKHIGVPAEQLIRLPKDLNDQAAVKAVMEKLGTPADATKYNFDDIKNADGTPLDPKTVEFYKQIAGASFLTQSGAVKMVQALEKQKADTNVKNAADTAAALALEKKALADNWGPHFAANEFIAKQAAAKLGPKVAEAVSALEGKAGYSTVMELFREIGVRLGEDKFVAGGGGTNQPMTREAAMAAKEGYKRDKAFVSRYNAGDTEAIKTMQALDVIIAAKAA